ncbi:unnamed protein product [Protopolystoma xenopodis]|uniref:Uncharacterized protein n=1 Tax=Protopolystoma xenopodis TaxID=117903 RepID=A0A448XK65_9PLAT|nr:unnamed protein product [Protopolystoma xenopodis]
MNGQSVSRLLFSIIGSPTVGLTRSASDVEDRKRPIGLNAVRKNETFGLYDTNYGSVDKRPASELSSKAGTKAKVCLACFALCLLSFVHILALLRAMRLIFFCFMGINTPSGIS